MELRFRIKFWFIIALWNVGQKLKEWSCLLAGGEHDYLKNENICIVCDHERKRPPLQLMK